MKILLAFSPAGCRFAIEESGEIVSRGNVISAKDDLGNNHVGTWLAWLKRERATVPIEYAGTYDDVSEAWTARAPGSAEEAAILAKTAAQ